MESHQQRQSVQIEMERLNKEQCAEPVPPESSRVLKRSLVLVSVVGVLAVIFTFLLFHFVFRPACLQEILPAANSLDKVNIIRRPQETTKGHYEIFKAEKYGKYLIYGWLRRSDSDNDSGDVKLEHWHNGDKRTLQEMNNKSERILFFGTEVQLFNSSRVHLQASPHSDSCFYIYEL